MTKEALTLALEALENLPSLNWIPEKDMQVQETITAIKEALSTKCVAQPEKTVCPFCSSEWVTAEQHDRKMDRMEQERCVGCEACIDTACGRDECPKGWPKAVQPEQEPAVFLKEWSDWRDMVVVNIMRHGSIDKHLARELANHFQSMTPQPKEPEQEPVAFFKTADLKAAWEAGYSAGRIAPLENKSTKVGTIGHIGDGKTTLTAAITPLLTEYKVGQEVKVTHLTYGGAVYNNKREIINSNQPPHKTVCIGRIVEIKQECENGAVIVKCEGDDKFLPRFHFYPQDNGPAQIVEISAQSKELKHEPEIWLDLEKLTAGGMAYATNFQSTTKQSKLYTTPPQRKPLTDEEIGAILEGVNAYGTRLYTFARAIEAVHGIKE